MRFFFAKKSTERNLSQTLTYHPMQFFMDTSRNCWWNWFLVSEKVAPGRPFLIPQLGRVLNASYMARVHLVQDSFVGVGVQLQTL
jgi:hypothetical protein